MKNRCVFLLLLGMFQLASTSAVHACLNSIGSSSVSQSIIVTSGLGPEKFLAEMLTHPNSNYWKDVLSQLQNEKPVFDRVENRTNRAVAMLHLGMVTEAIGILERLEKDEPGRYYTAANLGTAYELNGENAKALRWIKEGIRRKKDAHNGSEWLHVKILEAKLAIEKDPDWLTKHSVLGLNQTPNEQISRNLSVTDHTGQTYDASQIKAALIYQLHERLEFIKPPESVVASLLYDLSRILGLTDTAEHSAIIHAFAASYGADLMPWEATPPDPRVTPFTERPIFKYLIWAGASVIAVLILAGIVFLNRKFVR